MWEWVLGRDGAVAAWGHGCGWVFDLAWGHGYGDNADGGLEISFRWVLIGVLNGFFFNFCGFLCMVVVGVLLPLWCLWLWWQR